MSKASLSVNHRIIHLQEESGGNSEKLNVSIQIPMEYGWIEHVRIVVWTFERRIEYRINYKENSETHAIFETVIELPTNPVYHYYFAYECNGFTNLFKRNGVTSDTSITLFECFKMSVGFETPKWAKGATMYHIFVDRFARDDALKVVPMPRRTISKWGDPPVVGANENGDWNVDFFLGNIRGIINALDYLESLSVDILYLSPTMWSQSNHRYDTADYENVDPYAGTNEDMIELCQKAHARGMKVILDAVFNHTGNDSKYFNQYGTFDELGAYQSKSSPYYGFYRRVWINGKEDFDFWWGMRNLPVCDSNGQMWVNYITGEGKVIDKWFALGIDGLRLDVADELSDWMIEQIRIAVRRNKKDGFIIGEVWYNPMRMNRGYLSSGKGMDSVMNYLFVDALIRYYKYRDTGKLRDKIYEIFSEYPEDTIFMLMNFTSTHDISRIIDILGRDCFTEYGEWGWKLIDESHGWINSHPITNEEYEHGKVILKSFVVAMAFFPGIFSIFYGDEAGMTGAGNLANRGSFPWKNEDQELLSFFRRVLKIRRDNDFLRSAECNILKIDKEQFMYERKANGRHFIIAVSRTHHESLVSIDASYEVVDTIFKIGTSNKEYLAPYGAVVLEVRKSS